MDLFAHKKTFRTKIGILPSLKASDSKGCYLIDTIEQDLNEYVSSFLVHDNMKPVKDGVHDDMLHVDQLSNALDFVKTNKVQVKEFKVKVVQDDNLKDKLKLKAVLVKPEILNNIPSCSRDKVRQLLKQKPPNLDVKAFLAEL